MAWLSVTLSLAATLNQMLVMIIWVTKFLFYLPYNEINIHY